MINAGTIVVADCLVSDCADPRESIRSFVSSLAGATIDFDVAVATSERETGNRNAAHAHLMRGFGNLENFVDRVLDTYFHQCSLAISCRELATTFGYLADGGEVPGGGKRIVSAERARRINALMLTCGTYDRAGELAFEVGLPTKSGVGGGIVAVVPGKGAIAVWSPALGPSGNSVAGVEALRRFVVRTGWSVF